VDRANNGNADATPETGNALADRAIHGGNTLVSTLTMKGAALAGDRLENLAACGESEFV
jgi:hypothetical protein